MKKLLVIAVALASVNAFATRARVNALANSPHLIDTQTVFRNPSDMFFIGGDYATIESGKTTNGASFDTTTSQVVNSQTGAEGMLVRSMGDAKLGLALGHNSENATILRTIAGVPVTIRNQQNPIELSYGMKAGDMAWAGTLIYSNFKDKTSADLKEDSMGVRVGMRNGPLDADLRVGIANNASSTAYGKFKGTMGAAARVGYSMDTVTYVADVSLSGYKTESGTAAAPTAVGTETNNVENTDFGVSATNSHKKDGNEFFYGAGLRSFTSKNKTTEVKVTRLNLPVWLGLEVDAASWLTLRGSVTQSVLLNDNKTETSTTTSVDSTGTGNTVAAVGVGLKFNKITVDGSLGTLSGPNADQALNTTNLLGQVGLTYMF